MCGIAGILNLNHEPVAYTQIKLMTDAIKHRGPDGEGHFVQGPLALGHRRLAIIDLSPAGHQPMQTRDHRYTITYNGEVYNFLELRIQLEALGHYFHSRTDSEVILNAYAEWGAKCVDKFNGMFALAIWDKIEKKLFLARDRYGIKPLYYYHNDKSFVFASEIKAIIASNIYQTELDKEGLVEYFTFQNFFTNKTLFKDIKVLSAAHYAEINFQGVFTQHSYWDYDFSENLEIREDEAIEELDRLFCQAVQRQLISDVPVNAYLSGGVDSGAITMVASKYLPHMRTFTIGFDLSSASGLELAFDERVKAEHLSYLAKTEHYEMVLKAGDMERCMNSLVWHLEEPRVGQCYPNYYAAKLASKFGKVVLAGTGSDELFAGYHWRYFYSDDEKDFDQFIDEYYLKWKRLMPNRDQQTLVAPIWNEVKHIWTRDIFADVFKAIKAPFLKSSEDFLNYSLYFEAKTFLHGLLMVDDKLGMSHGIETRVPFLDNDFVDFSMKLPMSMKLDFTQNMKTVLNENNVSDIKLEKSKRNKKILRKTLERYIPKNILNADKQGFSAPDASWFKGESIEFVRSTLLDRNALLYEVFDPTLVQKLIYEHLDGSKNRRLLIWSLLYFEIWLKLFK